MMPAMLGNIDLFNYFGLWVQQWNQLKETVPVVSRNKLRMEIYIVIYSNGY